LSPTLTVTGLNPSTQYRFAVFAENVIGSSLSAEVSFWTAPDPPTGLTLVRATGSCVEFSWTAPINGCPSGCWYFIFQLANDSSTWNWIYD
jgi:hypothetical protein